MPDTQKIIDVLSEYKGDMESLNAFVSVAEAEFGPDWTLHIQTDLPDLPAGLKGKLDHAYNYYGATVAWNEIQEYLNAEHLDIAEVEERIPVLDYWLKFFGQSGKDVVVQLEQKIQALKDAQNETHQLVEPVVQEPERTTVNNVVAPETEMPDEASVLERKNALNEISASEEKLSSDKGNEKDSSQTTEDKINEAFPIEMQTTEIEAPVDTESIRSTHFAEAEKDIVAEPVAEAPVMPVEDPSEQLNEAPDSRSVTIEEPIETPVEPAPVLEEAPVVEKNSTPIFDNVERFKRPVIAETDLKETALDEVPIKTDATVATPIMQDEPVLETAEVSTITEEPLVGTSVDSVQEAVLADVSNEIPAEAVETKEVAEAVDSTEREGEEKVETVSVPILAEPKNSKEQDPELFMLDKIERQLDFLHQTQAWISARCVELGNIEPYTYTYYGFLMDVYQQTVRDIQSVLTDSKIFDLAQRKRPDTVKNLKDTLLVLKSELDFSKDLFNTNPSPLIDQNVSADAARQALGGLDTSTKKEYLGPAPDGFEMLDDPYETESGELDEAKLKSDYEKIEDGADVQLTEIADRIEPVIQENTPQNEKNLANSPKKGVEKKISISLGVKPLRKKAKIEPTDTE